MDEASQQQFDTPVYRAQFKEGYLLLLKQHDEFGYIDEKFIKITFWNKSSFDDTYDNMYHFVHG